MDEKTESVREEQIEAIPEASIEGESIQDAQEQLNDFQEQLSVDTEVGGDVDNLVDDGQAQLSQQLDIEPASDEDMRVDLDHAKLLEAYDETLRDFEEGEIVKGTVIMIDRDEVLVDVGYKSEGYIPISEFGTLPDGTPNVKVGDVVDVYLVKKEDQDGLVVLSKEIADQKIVWDKVAEAYERGEPILGRITKRIKGGLKVEIENVKAFLPASQVELRPVQNFDKYIGKTLEMKVIKLSRRRRNIVLSRRAILEEEREAKRQATLSELKVGQIREGIVKNITQFGAFIDLGGVDGLLHKSDMSWGRVNHPSELLSIGDKVEVVVLAIDAEANKISLGMKQKTPDPWLSVESKYPVGSTVTGKVVSVVDYGAFVELEPGVEGLIHVSEMSWTRRVPHPSKILKKGDIVEAKVLDIDVEKQKISLGLKQLQENPWERLAREYPVGSRITGKVRNLTDFGVFVEIMEGIDGLIHVSDLTWAKRTVNPSDILKEGDIVETVVLNIDPEKQRISLGLKQIEPDPWINVPQKYAVGSVVKGTIVNITNFGAFAKLEEGVEGLIHISEMDEKHVENPNDIVSIGDVVDVKVISLDPEERRIGLSIKEAKLELEKLAINQYMQENKPDKTTLAEVVEMTGVPVSREEDIASENDASAEEAGS